MTVKFDLHKLLNDVFAPADGETVLILRDEPASPHQDHGDWQERRRMAEEWHEAFALFPVHRAPLTTFTATGANNGDLPAHARQHGQTVDLIRTIRESNIVITLTQYSATAPLSRLIRQADNLRVASMPGVLKRMEQTALAADYDEVGRRTHVLADHLTRAHQAHVEFSSGHRMVFDLRFRIGHADDGQCRPGKPFPLINLPSGEAFIVPYEGEQDGVPSQTQGEIPFEYRGAALTLVVRHNRIVDVQGETSAAQSFHNYLREDDARRNIAELGLGCNAHAVVSGSVIEDEKAGMHWAFGRSEHLGGVTGPDAFSRPEHVVHQDIVYAEGCPFGVRELTLVYSDGASHILMQHNQYIIF